MPKIIAQKEDWIKLGYKLFAQKGIAGIVVEGMAKTLKCNKSSFYWHFKSKEVFIQTLVDFWVDQETHLIIQQADSLQTAREKIKRLIEIVFKQDRYIDFVFYLKRYAKNRPKIQKTIDNIDEQRMAYVANLLEELGYNTKEAALHSSLFYKYLIGYHEMLRNKKQSQTYVQEVWEELSSFLKIEE